MDAGRPVYIRYRDDILSVYTASEVKKIYKEYDNIDELLFRHTSITKLNTDNLFKY